VPASKRVKETLAPSTPPGAAGAPEVIEVAAGVFKNTCLELMERVADGTTQYLITKRGRPVAKLVAPDVAAPSPFGFLRGTVAGQGDIVAPDFAAWGDVG